MNEWMNKWKKNNRVDKRKLKWTKRKCYAALDHLNWSISIIDFVCIVRHDCVRWSMSSATTYIHILPYVYILSRDEDMMFMTISNLLPSHSIVYIYAYLDVYVRVIIIVQCSKEFFFLFSFSWLKWKSCENRLSLLLCTCISIIHFHIYTYILSYTGNLSSALKKTTIILDFFFNNKFSSHLNLKTVTK